MVKGKKGWLKEVNGKKKKKKKRQAKLILSSGFIYFPEKKFIWAFLSLSNWDLNVSTLGNHVLNSNLSPWGQLKCGKLNRVQRINASETAVILLTYCTQFGPILLQPYEKNFIYEITEKINPFRNNEQEVSDFSSHT